MKQIHKLGKKKIRKFNIFTDYVIPMSIAFILGWVGLFVYLYWFFN